METENSTLHLFLEQKPGGHNNPRIWLDYMLYSGEGGSFNLGLPAGAEEIAKKINNKLENMFFSLPITKILLHNGGNHDEGEKNTLPEQKYHEVHQVLRNNKSRVYFEPTVYLT